MENDALQQLTELGLEMAGILIAGLAVYATALVKKKTGIDIEAGRKVIEGGNRDALSSALKTAATLALGNGLVGKLAVDFMIDYAQRSSPEAAAMAERAGVLVERAQAALNAPVIKEASELVQALGGPDKLADALAQAKAWLPPTNDGRP